MSQSTSDASLQLLCESARAIRPASPTPSMSSMRSTLSDCTMESTTPRVGRKGISAEEALSLAQEAAMEQHTKLVVGASLPALFRDDDYQMCKILDIRLDPSDNELFFYVHFDGTNRRLDKWIPLSSLDISYFDRGSNIDDSDDRSDSKVRTRTFKRRLEELNHGGEIMDPVLAAAEREHEELTKVKNFNTVVFGKYEIDTWYFSPYPREITGDISKLYVCEWSLKYFRTQSQLDRHQMKYTLRHPPGDEIYRDQNLSMFEVDGRRERFYAQCLCLLAKLFLDHKTLYYDVDPFLFYVLTEVDEEGCHVVGYFSKEKCSNEGYNLACILTLPPYQRKGYGRFLIDFSYALSKKEKKAGTPERPLSDLGFLSYRSYWKSELLEILKNFRGHVTLTELSSITMIRVDDIVDTLQSMRLIKYYKGQHILSVSPKLLEDHRKSVEKNRLKVDMSKLHWRPLKLGDH